MWFPTEVVLPVVVQTEALTGAGKLRQGLKNFLRREAPTVLLGIRLSTSQGESFEEASALNHSNGFWIEVGEFTLAFDSINVL